MNYWLLLLPICIFLISYFVFPSIIGFATKLNYLDKGYGRKRHKESIPPIGGWLIYVSFAVTFIALFLISNFNLENVAIFGSVSGIFALGLIDDKFPMNALQKFAGQFTIAILLVFLGQVHFADYMHVHGLPLLIGKCLCVVIVVFVTNAYNLVDGINGLAALLGMVAISFLGLWLFSAGHYAEFILGLSIIAALFVFLRYNIFKPLVFLGDNGSMLIGFVAVYFAFIFIKTYTGFSSILLTKCNAEVGVALAAIAIPIADTLRLFILRPYYLRKSPFKADRNHVHHLLLRLGFSHAEASLLLFGLAILIVLAALAAQDLGSIAVILIGASICIAFLMSLDFFVFSKYRKRVNKKTVFNSLRNLSEELNNPVFIEYIFAISIFLLAISIPFHRVSTSIPTIILVFSFLVLFLRNVLVYKNQYWGLFAGKFKEFIKQPYSILVLLFLGYMTLHVLLINPSGNWHKLTIYFLLFVYWITIFQLEKIVQIKPRVLLTAFITGCLAFGVYILMQSFVEFPIKGWDGFFYKDLLSNVKANPVTHSLYYNLAIVFLGNNYKYLKKEEWRITYWIMLFFFIFMVALCSSKIGVFVLFFAIITANSNMTKNKKSVLTIITIYTILSVFIAFQFGVFTKAFLIGAFDSRLIVWQQSFEIIKENFWFGKGVGNSVSALEGKFLLINYLDGIEQKYNAQNQFIESFLETGVFGFLLISTFFAYAFIKAFIEKNTLYFVYTCIILAYMMTESLFQTQMGMVSFAFFNALFLAAFYNQDKKDVI